MTTHGFRFGALMIVTCFALGPAAANPIPIPLPASMPLEDMYCDITKPPIDVNTCDGLWATFLGDYHFSYIPKDLWGMQYPVPPAFCHFGVAMDGKSLPWYRIRMCYETALPEPEYRCIPVLQWDGPFPPQALFSVKFQHPLLRRSPGEYIYFYALGTGRYWPSYQKECHAYLDLTLPRDWCVRQLWLARPPDIDPAVFSELTGYDESEVFVPHAFAVTSERKNNACKTVVSIFSTAEFGPFFRDIVASIRPWYLRADCNGDGEVNVSDLVAVRVSLGNRVESDGDDSADVNGDGVVNVSDLVLVRTELGCDQFEGLADNARPIILRYNVSPGCTQEPDFGGPPAIEVWGRRLFVRHDIFYNCCPEYVRMCIAVKHNRIILREKAKEAAPCDCVCYFPMKGVAGPFPPGPYHLEMYDPYGRCILEREVTFE